MVNIILSSYNGSRYIAEQIESILDSGYRDLKLFVFDDVSTDDTVDIVREFEKKDNRVTLVKNAFNKGFCRNFIEGLEYTVDHFPADYYVFCDQDDVWFNDRLEVCLENMKAAEDRLGSDVPLMLFTDAVLTDENISKLYNNFFKESRLNTQRLDLAAVLMENKCIGCTSFMNHALASKIRGFDRRIRYHDWWVALTAAAFGKLIYVDKPTVMYRQHGNNQVGQAGFSEYVSSRAGSVQDMRRRIVKTIAQASAFHKQYAAELSDNNKRMVREFIAIGATGWFEQRRLIIKNRFYKSGFLRNIGMMLVI
ncbi:MAG: glycosyltransferase [Lachnospiraceae bacterium]|nr:glycosyltransferase [Lachnospiraceae bacterium]